MQTRRDSSDKLPDLDEFVGDAQVIRDDDSEDEHDKDSNDANQKVVFLDTITVPEAPHLTVYAKLTACDLPLVYKLTGYLQDTSNGDDDNDVTVASVDGFVNESASAWIGAEEGEERSPSFHAIDDEDQDVGIASVVLFDHRGGIRSSLNEAMGINSNATTPITSSSDPPVAPGTEVETTDTNAKVSKLHAGWRPDGVVYFSQVSVDDSADDTDVATLNALRLIRGITHMLAAASMIEMAVISPREHAAIAPHEEEDKALEELLNELDTGGNDGEEEEEEGEEEGTEEQSNRLAELRENFTTRVARQLMRIGFKQCASFPSECHYYFWISNQQQQGGELGTVADWTIAPVDAVADAVVHLAPREKRATDEDKVLLEAVSAGSAEGVRAAISEGASVNRAKALHIAIGSGRNDMVPLLLELGADVGLKDDIGLTPLHVCASTLAKVEDKPSFEAGMELLQLLLSKGADPSVKTMRGDDACGSVDESLCSLSEFMRVFGVYSAADATVVLLNENARRIKAVLCKNVAEQE